MNNRALKLGLFVFLGSWVALGQPGPAIVLDPNELPPAQGRPGDLGFGWTFRIHQPVVVTGLAFYDDGVNGLLQEHTVSLWRLTNAEPALWNQFGPAKVELASVLVPSGESAPLDGVWRKLDLPSALTLEVGSYGLLSALGSSAIDDPTISGPPSLFAAGLDSRFEIGAIFGVLPDGTVYSILDSFGAALGPIVFVQPIPEPTTALLGGVALLLIAFRRRPET